MQHSMSLVGLDVHAAQTHVEDHGVVTGELRRVKLRMAPSTASCARAPCRLARSVSCATSFDTARPRSRSAGARSSGSRRPCRTRDQALLGRLRGARQVRAADTRCADLRHPRPRAAGRSTSVPATTASRAAAGTPKRRSQQATRSSPPPIRPRPWRPLRRARRRLLLPPRHRAHRTLPPPPHPPTRAPRPPSHPRTAPGGRLIQTSPHRGGHFRFRR